ncbi:WhiB family transcriptional regulator [Pseudactinotalea sp. Z1748]|uniref:WhiB family transcriptional regulator n=1 Tax=Pseudactinotalea sp. Z1748 TaxID=3413027 RepID=UPI003C7DFC9A
MQYTSILDQPSGSSTTWPLDAGTLVAGVQVDLPCQDGATSDLWFAEHTQQIERAKAMCHSCPLKAECLEGALARQEPWGVWGGEVLVDGAIVARKRGRGRPRKDDPSAPSNHRSHSAA